MADRFGFCNPVEHNFNVLGNNHSRHEMFRSVSVCARFWNPYGSAMECFSTFALLRMGFIFVIRDGVLVQSLCNFTGA